jgi:hypothetical protein
MISIINSLETSTKTLDDFFSDKKEPETCFIKINLPAIIYSYDIITIIFPVTCKHISSHKYYHYKCNQKKLITVHVGTFKAEMKYQQNDDCVTKIVKQLS